MAITKTKVIQSLLKINAETTDDRVYEGAMKLASEILGVTEEKVADMLYNGVEEDSTIDNDLLWNILLNHAGNTVEIATYGDGPESVTLEDMDNHEIILDAEIYTLCARDDIK